MSSRSTAADAIIMTAAGTVKAARVLILGAGVAGLQALATRSDGGRGVVGPIAPCGQGADRIARPKFGDLPMKQTTRSSCARVSGGYARPIPAIVDQRKRPQSASV